MAFIMVFVTYFFICLALAISPGPDIIFVFTQSLQHNVRAGMLVVLGLCTGLVAHMLFALLGLNALLLASPKALFLIQVIGALYLSYLAYKSLQAFWQKKNALSTIDKNIKTVDKRNKLSKFYLRGFVLNITNPKVLLFFIAVLPQFIDPQMHNIGFVTQTIIFGFLSILATFICFTLVAISAGKLANYLTQFAQAGQLINLFSGIIFIGLGVYLVFATI